MSGHQSKHTRVRRKLKTLFARLDHLANRLALAPADKPHLEHTIRAEMSAIRFSIACVEKTYPGIEVPEKYKQEIY